MKSLPITVKFSVAFGILSAILITVAAIGYGAMRGVVEANNLILVNGEMQRLTMGMSRNWETVQSLRHNYLSQSPIVGPERAYDLYALPAGAKIAEVIRDGAALRRLISSTDASENLQAREADIQNLLSTVSQYATTLEEVSSLERQNLSETTGPLFEMEQNAEALFDLLKAQDSTSEMLILYHEMRLTEIDLLTIHQNLPKHSFFINVSLFHQAIEDSGLSAADKATMRTTLDEYEKIAGDIFTVNTQIQENLDLLDSLDQSIEPIIIEIMVVVDNEVNLARLHIEETRQSAIKMLAAAIAAGLISALVIGVTFHRTITKNIIRLDQVATHFQEGDMEARTDIQSLDEIGHLARTFNAMAKAVQNLTAELREQAIRDSLTGLYNRRFLDSALPLELAKASRIDFPVTIVMMDIDGFKNVNDQYGHAVGDKILIELGEILKSSSRESDIACRFGGDEFIILMLNATLEEGKQRTEYWMQQFNQHKSDLVEDKDQPTLSAGLAQWQTGETPDDLLKRVDDALYRAKTAGRNQTATLP